MRNTVIILLTAGMAFCSKDPQIEADRALARRFGTLPKSMPGAEKDTKDLVALGRKLYFEKRLSANDSQSCESCHMLQNGKAGVDNLPTSPGAFGKNGDRNSPTTINAGFHFVQFWDGRAADLVAQAKGPILNPVEMAMPSADAVVKKISDIGEYPPLFAKAFGSDGKAAITYENIAIAIAAFERTLISADRFDDFINGDDDALSAEERRGLNLFVQSGCNACHSGALMGGKSYQIVGAANPWPNQKDQGRFAVTRKAEDKMKFKVPSLRNVALTAPYFHDGSEPELRGAVEKMAWHQLNKKLQPDESAAIVAFLQSLSQKSE